MVPCFNCNRSFDNIDQLVVHFKYECNLTSGSIYKCPFCELGYFCNLNGYKRHLKNHLLSQREVIPQIPTANLFVSNPQVQQMPPVLTSQLTESVTTNVTSNSNNIITANNCLHDQVSGLIIQLQESALKIVLSLISQNNLARKEAFQIIELFKNNILNKMSCGLIEIFGDDISSERKEHFELLTETIANPFVKVDTEYRLIKNLKELGVFEPPISFSINNEISVAQKNGLPTIDVVIAKGAIMPIEFQIKNFFERPGILKLVLENIKKYEESGEISHFVNAELWKMKTQNMQGKICIPYFLYTDGVSIDNDLGSHGTDHTLSAYYYNFPGLPSHWQSSLKNIFVAMVYAAKYEAYGYEKCLYLLIDVIIKLETEGLSIAYEGQQVQVYFVLGVILGDNLGLNSILGFSKCFRANFHCRFCKLTRSECHLTTKECENLLRTKENHETDLSLPFSECGLVEDSTLNKIPSFHVVENYSVDVMHDIPEGIAGYDIAEILLHFLKFTTLKTINTRKQNFDYGSLASGNRSNPIKMKHLQNKKLKMSASEMLTFVHFLPIMLGDLIPHDEVWEFLLILVDLIDLVLCTSFTEAKLLNLEKIVEKHNSLYISLFNQTLKPKHHHLIHYCRIIRFSGPLKFLWCMRFESKHREITLYCQVVFSRVNIAWSVAMKACFKNAYSQLFESDYDKPKYFFSTEKIQDKLYFNDIRDSHAFATEDKLLKSVIFNGLTYKKFFYLVANTSDLDSNSMLIYQIIDLFFSNNNTFAVLQEYEVLGYDRHYASFRVGDPLNSKIIKKLASFKYPPIELHSVKDGSGQVFRVKNF
jgi:hypothetical protein